MKTAPDFWWKPGSTLASWLLSPAGWIYGLVSGRRMLKKPKARSLLPVICVGNFVVGGAMTRNERMCTERSDTVTRQPSGPQSGWSGCNINQAGVGVTDGRAGPMHGG